MQSDWRWHIIQYKFQEHKLVNIFDFFRKHQIEPILIKGWAAARNYPMKEERVFLDADICVDPRDYERTLEILENSKEQTSLVDLHRGLRHLDTVEWENLFANTRLVDLEGTSIRLLRPEDHLRVMCVHWLNDGGAFRERLQDIRYAVENRADDFDWDRCLNVVDKKRRRWIICAIGLAHKYAGLEVDDTPIAEEVQDLPRWLIKTVEREWSDDTKLIRLQECVWDRKELFRQLKKRFPPNAIQATVEVNGEFDNRPRIFYQIGDILIRIKPSISRFARFFSKT